jgi:hypothetical protein
LSKKYHGERPSGGRFVNNRDWVCSVCTENKREMNGEKLELSPIPFVFFLLSSGSRSLLYIVFYYSRPGPHRWQQGVRQDCLLPPRGGLASSVLKMAHLHSHARRGPRHAFFYPDGVNRPSRAPGSLFSPGSGPSSIRRAQAIPGLPGRARGLRTKEMRAKRRGKFPRVMWPRPIGESGRSSSSSSHLPRMVVFPALVFHAL